jgi:hypothetical protein
MQVPSRVRIKVVRKVSTRTWFVAAGALFPAHGRSRQ